MLFRSAARGIAYQVMGAVNGFVQNFQMAMNPQIIKSFALGDIRYMHQLILQGAKYSFFLIFILSLPILLETETILRLWLKIVPEYAVIFTQLVIINILIDSISGPLMTAAQASGKIKIYQGVVGGLLLLILPLSYLFIKLGHPPQVTIYISIVISMAALYARLLILRGLVKINIKDFLSKVLFRCILVVSVALILPLCVNLILEESVTKFILVTSAAFLSAPFAVYIYGLNKIERLYFLSIIKKLANYKKSWFYDNFDNNEKIH